MVLKLRYAAPDNWRQAKCTGLDPELFFSEDEEDQAAALRYCNGTRDGRLCSIRDECLTYALTNNCRDGVWGGCDEMTRKAMRKRWPMKRNAEPRPEWRWMTHEDSVGKLDPAALAAWEDLDPVAEGETY